MKAHWFLLAALMLAGCAEKPKPPPGPDYTALIRKLAQTEAKLETGIRLNEAAQMAAELRAEIALTTFTNSLDPKTAKIITISLDSLSVLDRHRLKLASYGLRDPVSAPKGYYAGSRDSSDKASAMVQEQYPKIMEDARRYSQELRLRLMGGLKKAQ